MVLEVVGDGQADLERQPDVVQGAQPGLAFLLGQPDPSAAGGQRGQHGAGRRHLAVAEFLLGEPAEVTRRLGVIGIGVGQQPGQHRVVRRGGGAGLAEQPGEVVQRVSWSVPGRLPGRAGVRRGRSRSGRDAGSASLARPARARMPGPPPARLAADQLGDLGDQGG